MAGKGRCSQRLVPENPGQFLGCGPDGGGEGIGCRRGQGVILDLSGEVKGSGAEISFHALKGELPFRQGQLSGDPLESGRLPPEIEAALRYLRSDEKDACPVKGAPCLQLAQSSLEGARLHMKYPRPDIFADEVPGGGGNDSVRDQISVPFQIEVCQGGRCLHKRIRREEIFESHFALQLQVVQGGFRPAEDHRAGRSVQIAGQAQPGRLERFGKNGWIGQLRTGYFQGPGSGEILPRAGKDEFGGQEAAEFLEGCPTAIPRPGTGQIESFRLQLCPDQGAFQYVLSFLRQPHLSRQGQTAVPAFTRQRAGEGKRDRRPPFPALQI